MRIIPVCAAAALALTIALCFVPPVGAMSQLSNALVNNRINDQWAPLHSVQTSGQRAAARQESVTEKLPIVREVAPIMAEAGSQSASSVKRHTYITPSAEPSPLRLTLTPGNARLSSMLAEFARLHDWSIAWEIDRDFPIDYPARFEGTFLDIIANVVLALRTTDAPIRAKVYHGNKVIRIVNATR